MFWCVCVCVYVSVCLLSVCARVCVCVCVCVFILFVSQDCKGEKRFVVPGFALLLVQAGPRNFTECCANIARYVSGKCKVLIILRV